MSCALSSNDCVRSCTEQPPSMTSRIVPTRRFNNRNPSFFIVSLLARPNASRRESPLNVTLNFSLIKELVVKLLCRQAEEEETVADEHQSHNNQHPTTKLAKHAGMALHPAQGPDGP